jgi:hypothetical protein
MKSNLKKTGQMTLALVALAAGAGLSILLYNGIMHGDLPASLANTGSQETSPFVTNLLQDGGWLKPACMFLVMLAGMLFNQIFENLKVQKEAGETQANVFRIIADGITGITFWMAFFVSPLIFYGTYYLVDKLPDGAVGYFYAFQGGFFWYNIFSRFELKSKKQQLQTPVI